jgi:hypothetical protein
LEFLSYNHSVRANLKNYKLQTEIKPSAYFFPF